MKKSLVGLLVVLGLVAAACGSDSDTPAATTEVEAADTDSGDTDSGDTETTEAESAGAEEADSMEDEATSDDIRIVSLSATATEMLFAIGAGDLVVAADSYSNYPAEAPTSELNAFEPNLEAIAAEDPTHVVISWDPGDLVAGLDELGITSIVHPPATTLDDVYAQIADLGIATGHEDGAAQTNADIQAGLEEVVANAPAAGDPPIRVYHELDDTFFSASSSSFIGQLYALLGVENVADAADPDNESFGFPQLSAEYLIEADPQLIVITDQVGYSTEDVASRPGWDILSAAQNGGILQVDADVASRWGPRIVDFLQIISDAIAEQLVES